MLNWTTTSETNLSRSILGLISGKIYYLSVQARNAGALWSLASSSPSQGGAAACYTSQSFLYLPSINK